MNEQEAYLASVQGTYRYYCYHVNNPVKGKMTWVPSRFHKFLCDTVQEFVERDTDKAYEILILNTPPQHGKSVTITQTLPSWYLMKNPTHHVIEVSYNNDYALKFGKSNLDKVREYGNIFGVSLDKSKRNANEFQLAKTGGGMVSRGLFGGITGNAGHLIIIDDPIKNPEEADSETYRKKVWEVWKDAILSRVQSKTKIILIMTRWHEDDLAGRIMESEADRTTVINLPIEAEDDDPMGRSIGEALCPEIGKDEAWIADFKKSYMDEKGQRSWLALFMGHPSSAEGNMLKREWWRFYDINTIDSIKFDTILMGVDAAFKDSEKNDFVCIEVWGKSGNKIYLIDLLNERMNFTETVRAIQIMKARHPKLNGILIEDKANGAAIIQVLRKKIMGIISVTPRESKEARVQAVSIYIEAGNIYLPQDKKKTWEFIDQCASFPNGKFDDMVDAMTMVLKRMIFTRGSHKRIAEEIVTSWGNALKPKRKASKIHVI